MEEVVTVGLHLEHLAGSEVLARIAEEATATASQVALAWLLQQSAVTILIPGTSSLAHLEENVAARDVRLSEAQLHELDRIGATDGG
jgi:aryl-alcohol dehydrogenase-like predicted oxidoreductase